MPTDSTSILIVGGGFSGTLTAIHLLHSTVSQSTSITLVNPTSALGRGLAYRSNDDNQILNVPAGNMSAFVEQPSHFLEFCQSIDPSINSGSFVSRRLYGRYLEHCLHDAVSAHPNRFHAVEGEVDEVHALPSKEGFTVNLTSGQCFIASHVVLALGHQLPRFPLALAPTERAFVIDAWDFDRMNRLSPDASILIIGTGHTAVDALFHLTQQAQPRTITMLSRHGFLPHPHRLNPNPPPVGQYPNYVGEAPLRMRTLLRQLRQEIARQANSGGDWRDVLNQLRPHTPRLWQALPLVERRRFLRHAVAFWDVHRHRLAPQAADRLNSLLQTEKVQVLAARLLAMHVTATRELSIEIRPRGQQTAQTLTVAAIVNCTGPNMAIGPRSHSLFQQLVEDQLLTPSPCGLGIQVNDRYQPISAQGHTVNGLWYVGPMLKARHWEATAVPELRGHAQQLAREIAKQLAPCSALPAQPESV